MSHRTPSQRLDSVDDLLLFRLGLLSAEAGAMVVRLCEGRHGITRREWRLLGLLYGHEGVPPSTLAERVHLDRARTSRAISTLVKKQLVTRTTSPSDRRGARLALTEAGVRLYQTLMPEVQDINRRILGVLSPEDMVQLDNLLARLHVSAQALKHEIAPELPKTYRLRGRKSAGGAL
ncbi:MAG: HTH-type transcriptional regulator MhqR [Pseudomonadota bacterium]